MFMMWSISFQLDDFE